MMAAHCLDNFEFWPGPAWSDLAAGELAPPFASILIMDGAPRDRIECVFGNILDYVRFDLYRLEELLSKLPVYLNML